MGELITLKDIKHNEAIDKYLKRASLNLEAMKYTEHGYRHNY